MKIKILRQKAPDSEPYWESFNYDGTLEISVAGMLDELNFGDDIKMTLVKRRIASIGRVPVCKACAAHVPC